MRGTAKRFVFFLASIAIGVGAIVGVGNIAANFEAMTEHEARNLLAGDVEIRLSRLLSDEGEKVLAELEKVGVAFMRVSELVGMAANEENGRTQLVELKAVEPDYPYYGRLDTDPSADDPFADAHSVWVQEGLLIRLQLKVGDQVSIGEGRFNIRGVIRREPDRVAGPFSLGPRVLLSQEGLKIADLVQTGSRIRRKILVKGMSAWPPEKLKTSLEGTLSEEQAEIKTYREVRPRLARFLGNFSTYLGLVGLITLMIGGIGVAGNINAYLSERIETIAILKSLGGNAQSILLIYLLLALALGGLGSLIGIGLGMGIFFALENLLAGFLPPGFAFQMTYLPMIQGMAMGLLTTFLFSLWPLRVVGEISPARVFRHSVEVGPNALIALIGLIGRNWRKPVLLAAVMGLGWIVLAVWQAGSWRLGASLLAALGVSIALLMLFGKVMLRLLKKMRPPKRLVFRYGLGNLFRPGRQVTTIFLSLGVGVMILLTLAQVERRLLSQLEQNIPAKAPGLFLIDIQSDQREALKTVLSKQNLNGPPELTPLIRSRLRAIDGKKVSEMDLDDRQDRWYFTREYVLTYQENLPEYNIVKKGAWWGEASAEGLISVEEEAARHLGIGLGSEVEFDIQGVMVKGKIGSIREVDWGSMAVNFYFIFPPAALAGAPETYVATVSADRSVDLPLQNAVIGEFPNITVIPIREVLETISKILREISRTVHFMALLCLSVGLIVVAGAIAATRARRVHEMVLFKTLGATRPDLMAMMAVEYAALGTLAALVGGGLSIAVSWGIVHFFLDIPWQMEWATLALGGLATIVLTLLTGFLTTYKVLGEKPLAVLRAE